MTDELHVCILLGTLADSWKFFIAVLKNSTLNNKLSMSAIKEYLFNEETKKKHRFGSYSDALITVKRERDNTRNSKNVQNHNNSRGWSKLG